MIEKSEGFDFVVRLAGPKTRLRATAGLQNPSVKLVETGQSARGEAESRAHYARDPSG